MGVNNNNDKQSEIKNMNPLEEENNNNNNNIKDNYNNEFYKPKMQIISIGVDSRRENWQQGDNNNDNEDLKEEEEKENKSKIEINSPKSKE